MDTGYYFDNVLVGSQPAAAAAYRTSHWAPKLAAEVGHCWGGHVQTWHLGLYLDHGHRLLLRY